MSDESSVAMKSQRRRHFEERVAAASGAVTMTAGGKVVTIHPLADETALLSSLGVSPEECTSVDCYWAISDDVVFLQLMVTKETHRPPGLYARLASYPPHHVNLVVVIDAPYITFSLLEQATRDLLRVGWTDFQLEDSLVRLSRPVPG